MQTSASISEDWLLPKSSLKKREGIPCWKEPQCSVKHGVMQHGNGNKMTHFGREEGFFCFVGVWGFVCLFVRVFLRYFISFFNARLQDECFQSPGSLLYWNF